MTKTDDILLELSRAFNVYVESVPPFELKNETFRLVGHYVASPWIRCDLCGNYPVMKVSVVRGSDGHELRVDNECIEPVTARKVSEWFEEYRAKRKAIIGNRRYIDCLASLLPSYDSGELSFPVSETDLAGLRDAFKVMSLGFSLTGKQEQLVERYVGMSVCVQ